MVRNKACRSMIEILMNFPLRIRLEYYSNFVLLLFCEEFGVRSIIEFLERLRDLLRRCGRV